MNAVFIEYEYADALLALGISAAFGVMPHYTGNAYIFPGEPAHDTLPFPVAAEADPEPPYTYHRYKNLAVATLGGRGLLEILKTQWDSTLPLYHELFGLLTLGYSNWKNTRFAQVSKPYFGAATFRPHQAKDDKGNVSAFWLPEALRAIGFLSFASTRQFKRDTHMTRWCVYIPALPDFRFSEVMRHLTPAEVAPLETLHASIVGSQLQLPRIFVQQYAELNALARTPFFSFAIEPRDFTPDTCNLLLKLSYGINLRHLAEQPRLANLLLDAIEGIDAVKKLAQIVPEYNFRFAEKGGAIGVQTITTDLITALLTSSRGVEVW